MLNNTNHNCLSCGVDISHKRSDAIYCSDRCRMRYQRKQKKVKIIEQLADLFNRIPNHTALCTAEGYQLQYWEATKGNWEILAYSDLLAMSIADLESLKSKKQVLLMSTTVINFFKK